MLKRRATASAIWQGEVSEDEEEEERRPSPIGPVLRSLPSSLPFVDSAEGNCAVTASSQTHTGAHNPCKAVFP